MKGDRGFVSWLRSRALGLLYKWLEQKELLTVFDDKGSDRELSY